MRVAAAKYAIQAPASFEAFAQRLRGMFEGLAAQGVELAVLPEYLSLELAATFGPEIASDLPASLAAIQRYRAPWLALFSTLARETGIAIAAGTFLLDDGGGRYRNRADLLLPRGGHAWQDKLQLTGFEKATGLIDGGDALKVVDTGTARLGLAVCYDIEFPLPVRAQYEAGARLLLVPSCTDTAAGATRVQVGCLARALENRCFVAKAVTAGEAPWSPVLDINSGEAAIYAPMDGGFPADGILARTAADAGWAIAEIAPGALEASRAQAQVANDRDWPGQSLPALSRARVERPG